MKLPPSSSFNPQLDQQQIELPRARRLGLFALVCVIYFTVSGGAFGVEPLVGAVGPGLALLLIVVTPFVWSLPMSLIVAELATLLPEEGGYYVWVKESLGEFWAVQEAWWTMAYSIALMAMLPLLFVTYLDFFLRSVGSGVEPAYAGLGPLARWLLTVAIIVTATIVNLFGARDVGRSSKISAVLVVGSFAALVLLWVLRHAEPSNVISIVKQDLASNRTHGLLLGLSRSRQEAIEIQHNLTDYLYTAHRLSLESHKTKVIHISKFVAEELRDPEEEETRAKTSRLQELVDELKI